MRNLFAAIEARRAIALDRFIYALGIRHVGEINARLLARAYGTIEAFRDAMLAAAKGDAARAPPRPIASSTISKASARSVADAIADFFGEPHNVEVLGELLREVEVEAARSRARPRRSPARPWCSPARWRRLPATRPRPGPSVSAPRSRARSRRRPTTWWRARGRIEAAKPRAWLKVLSEDEWLALIGE